MGCLCSSKLCMPQKPVTRRATYSTARDFGDISFQEFSSFRKFHSEYKILRDSIGSGLFGQIYLCRQISTNKTFAVKIISKAGLPTDHLKKRLIEGQVKIMQEIDHPSILKIFDFFEDARNFYLVMEYVRGGDLFNKIEKYGRFSEKLAAKIMKQLLSAIAHLHSNHIIHRDIKCENILVEEHQAQMVVKLIDFDTVVKKKIDEEVKGVYGTVYYMAPEVIQGGYSEKCDIWSAGVVLYTLITQHFPFGGDSDEAIMKAIAKNEINFEIMKTHKVSAELIDFFQMILKTDPEHRLSASAACVHPWILKYTCMKNPFPISISDPSFTSSLKHALKIWALKTIVPSNELAEYHMMFINIDQDFDGVIARHELERLFDFDSCDKILRNADCNMNGVLEYHEFLSLVVKGETIKKYSKQIIEELDKDNSGKIEVQSLISFLQYSLEAGFGEQGDGEISNGEILELMCN